MPIHYLIPTILVIVGLIAALISKRSCVAVPVSLVTAGLGAVLTGLIAAERLYLPAVVVLAGTVGLLAIAYSHVRPTPRPIRRAPGKCPGWCDIDHPQPLAGQHVISHERVTGAVDLHDGGTIEVRVGWMEYLTGPAGDPPIVMLSVYGQHATDIELTPDEAAVLATALAADLAGHLGHAYSLAFGDKAGWMPRALAEAAQFLGYRSGAIAGGAA